MDSQHPHSSITHNNMITILPSTSFPLLVSFLHLLIFVSTITAPPNALCIETEKQALLDFKLSFEPDPDGFLSNWGIDNADCCTWGGVSCDFFTGHVNTLYLYRLKSHKLRPSLLELPYLTSLILGGNQFPMRIPKFIGSLSNLGVLHLADSEFFGEIPPQLGNLSKLEILNFGQSNGLYSNNLHWLSRLSSLEQLDLSDVNLSNAIDWASTLHMLPNLSSFYCRSCSLPPPLIPSISQINLTSPGSLDLSNNSVSSSTFSYLVNGTNNLGTLYLDYMKLENSNIHEFLGPVIAGSKYSLLVLSLVGNNLNTLPFEVSMLPALMSLDVSFNRISGSLAKNLQYLSSNLTSLDASSNLLKGTVTLDVEFSKFSKLDVLRLSGNNLLTLNFSNSLVPPFQLSTLYLRSCKVGPSFPNWILTQKSLVRLDISNSMISGAIPDAFWELTTRLSYFNLSHNKINCKIPNLSLNASGTIDLSSNNFYGAIPFFLFSTYILDLSHNRFSSFHPLHPRVLLNNRMRYIDLNSNCLSGSLPKWLFQVDYLYGLNLANNNLSGTLPIEIGSLWQLRVLHLSNNKFSGQLPLSMKNCTHLIILELANNKFSGVVPFWFGESLSGLISLNLRSNNFIGELPYTLCHLQGLQILDLSNNQISGCIPGCVHNFTAMSTRQILNLTLTNEYYMLHSSYENQYETILDYALVVWKGDQVEMYSRNLDQRNVFNLSGNLLRGEIPIGVTTLKELKSLDLSRNDLNGSIPDKIGLLKSLEVLKLSSNRLSGEIPRSLAALTFLGALNLSNNDLSGRIPSSTQLQGFDPSSFAGNPKLCGKPLPTKCPGDEDDDKKHPPSSKNARDEDDESFDIQVFLASLGIGFAVAFLGVLGTLHFNRPWRLAFFQLSENIADRIFVATSLFPSRIKRSLCFRKANEAPNM